MKAIPALMAGLLVFLAAFPGAMAMSVPSGQRSIGAIVETGGHADIYLVLQDISSDTIISATGDKPGWISFGGNATMSVHPSLASIIPVHIEVPGDAQLGRYEMGIMAGSEGVSVVSISTTLRQDEIRSLQSLADVDSRIDIISGRLAEMNLRINSTDQGVQTLASSQSEISALRNETKSISTEIGEIKAKQSQPASPITGMLTEGVQMSFAAGFVVGGIVIFFLSGKVRGRRGVESL